MNGFGKKFIAKKLLTKKLKKKMDRIGDKNKLVALSKPDINPTIFDSSNNLHTEEILHTDLIDISTEF